MRTKPRLLQTQAFRIVLVYVLLFAFSVTALLFFTYWNTRRTLDDQTDQIIPTMMKSLVQGANFNATVSKANTELQNVLNTGKSS